MPKFFGKYRGSVENNVDPQMMGRVQVKVPAVLGDGTLSWAMPCAPFAGSNQGVFMVPPVGANIWVEFEAGNPDYPIYSGGFWGIGEAPAAPAVPQMKVIKTETATITLNDLPGAGGVTVEYMTGAKIKMTVTGIEIDNGMGCKISMMGPRLTIDAAQLEITSGTATVNVPMTQFTGVVRSETLITNAVVSTSYTPGAGNIW